MGKKTQRKLHRDNFDKNPIRQVSYLTELVWTSNHLQRKVGTHSKYTKQMWLLLHMSYTLKGTIKSLREQEYTRLKKYPGCCTESSGYSREKTGSWKWFSQNNCILFL